MSVLYTEEFILEQIKAAELALSDTTTASKVDTGMSAHSFQRAPEQASNALYLWKGNLQRSYPYRYAQLYGRSHVRYRGRRRV